VFIFISFILSQERYLKKLLLQLTSRSTLPMFSSRNFMVSGLYLGL